MTDVDKVEARRDTEDTLEIWYDSSDSDSSDSDSSDSSGNDSASSGTANIF